MSNGQPYDKDSMLEVFDVLAAAATSEIAELFRQVFATAQLVHERLSARVQAVNGDPNLLVPDIHYIAFILGSMIMGTTVHVAQPETEALDEDTKREIRDLIILMIDATGERTLVRTRPASPGSPAVAPTVSTHIVEEQPNGRAKIVH